MPFERPGGPRRIEAPASEHGWLTPQILTDGLPTSFYRDGFASAADIRKPRLLVGIDGESDTGKTEFAMSGPGPGLGICLDRGIDGALNNATPPTTRNRNWAFKVISAPLPTQAVQREYLEYWREFYNWYRKALDNQDAKTVLVDGDSDSWELQRLAEFGKLTQIPPIMYTNVNAARKAMYSKAWDSNKVVIFTNKVKAEYIDEIDPVTGQVVLDSSNKPKQKKSGNLQRQGFMDQDYLFHIQLRSLYRPVSDDEGQGWGVRITKCKSNRSLVGMELWDNMCNIQTLVQIVYPDVPMKVWGY